MPWIWIIFITLTLYLFLKRNKQKKGQKELPGPTGLPLLGNIHQLGKMPHEKFTEWTDTYGEIYQVKLATQLAVVLSNPKMIKDIFSNDANFTGRPHIDGVVNSEGELWEVHRRFLLRQLRDFGFGKSAMENLIVEELNEVIGNFKENEGKPIYDMKKILTLAVINALWSVVSCKRFNHDDPKLLKLVYNSQKVVSDIFENGAGVILFAPWIRHIFPTWSGYKGFRKVFDENRKWFEENVDEHKRTFDENNIRDFIDVFLAEVKKTDDPKSEFYGARAERQLVATLSDIFFAGNDTTSTTLAWGIFYLCKNLDVQSKFQEEIKSVTNNSRTVSVSDRLNMPYTLALIDEVLRKSSIVPIGVQHRALEDKEFQGYFIPKDTLITPNMYYIHHNKQIWQDPENFRPERFLTTEGKYKKSDNLIPFQIGRRQCVGETMARDTIFIFLTNIFQRFTVGFDPNSPEPSSECRPNFLLHPQPYSVVTKDRMSV